MSGEVSGEIYKALTGRTDRAATSFDDMVRELIQYRAVAGISRRAQSRQTGIPETTLRRWEGGIDPKAQEARLPQLVSAYRAQIMTPGAAARWRADQFSWTVTGVPTKGRSARTADRDLSASKLKIRPGTGEKIVAAYLAGDDKGAARAFVAGIGDPWYRQVMFGSWVAAEDDDLAYEGYDVDSDYSVGVSAS